MDSPRSWDLVWLPDRPYDTLSWEDTNEDEASSRSLVSFSATDAAGIKDPRMRESHGHIIARHAIQVNQNDKLSLLSVFVTYIFNALRSPFVPYIHPSPPICLANIRA